MASVIYLDKKGRKEPIFTLTKGDAKTKNVRFMLPADDGETAIDSLIWMISIHNAGGKDDATKLQKIHHEDHIHLNWQCGWVAAAEEGITTIQIIGYNEDGDRQWSSGEYCILVNPLEDTQIPKEDITELQELIADAAEAMETATQETMEAAQRADESAEAAGNAAQAATEAAEAANTAAQAATEAAEAAYTTAQAATEAAEAADTAAQAATEAAGAADNAANAANTAAEAADNARLAIAEELNKKAPAIYVDASGDIVTITDGAEGMPVQSLITHVEPKETGEGEKSPANPWTIIGWDGVTAQRAGKNLIPKSEFVNQNYFGVTLNTQPDGSIVVTGTYTGTTVGDVLIFSTRDEPIPAGTYMLTGCPAGGGIYSYRLFVYVYKADGSITYVNEMGSGAKITLEEGDQIKIMIRLGQEFPAGETLVFRLQLEVGSASTPYEPYNGQTLTAALPETLYGFDKNWTTGLVTVTHDRIVATGDEGYSLYEYKGKKGIMILNQLKQKCMRADGVCTHAPVTMDLSGGLQVWYGVGDNEIYVAGLIDALGVSTLEDAVAWIKSQYAAGTPVTFVYKLDEPYTIQLTPQQLETLKGVNNIWSNAGATEVTYAADTKMYIDQKIAAIAAAIV